MNILDSIAVTAGSAAVILSENRKLTRAKKLNHPTIKQIAGIYGKTPTQIMIRWSLQHDLIIIPKSQNLNRIVENFKVFDFTIDDADIARLDSLNENYRAAFW